MTNDELETKLMYFRVRLAERLRHQKSLKKAIVQTTERGSAGLSGLSGQLERVQGEIEGWVQAARLLIGTD